MKIYGIFEVQGDPGNSQPLGMISYADAFGSYALARAELTSYEFGEVNAMIVGLDTEVCRRSAWVYYESSRHEDILEVFPTKNALLEAHRGDIEHAAGMSGVSVNEIMKGEAAFTGPYHEECVAVTRVSMSDVKSDALHNREMYDGYGNISYAHQVLLDVFDKDEDFRLDTCLAETLECFDRESGEEIIRRWPDFYYKRHDNDGLDHMPEDYFAVSRPENIFLAEKMAAASSNPDMIDAVAGLRLGSRIEDLNLAASLTARCVSLGKQFRYTNLYKRYFGKDHSRFTQREASDLAAALGRYGIKADMSRLRANADADAFHAVACEPRLPDSEYKRVSMIHDMLAHELEGICNPDGLGKGRIDNDVLVERLVAAGLPESIIEKTRFGGLCNVACGSETLMLRDGSIGHRTDYFYSFPEEFDAAKVVEFIMGFEERYNGVAASGRARLSDSHITGQVMVPGYMHAGIAVSCLKGEDCTAGMEELVREQVRALESFGVNTRDAEPVLRKRLEDYVRNREWFAAR